MTPTQRYSEPMTSSHPVPSVDELARSIAETSSDDDRLRMAVGWADEVQHLDAEAASALVEDEPSPTGSNRFDALLAGLVEHLAFHMDLPTPEWVHSPQRFLHSFWFPVDLPSVRAMAFRDAPASLARRGVFLDRRDLERV